MTDVYTDIEYSATMLAVLAEHRGFAIRKMPLKFGTGGLKMTIDEAIEERQKVIEVQVKLYEEASTNESKEIIKSATDNDRQLAEWLTQLKEVKRLLKATISDIYEVCSCNTWGCDICEHLRETCDYDDRFTWRHKAEVLKLIGEDDNESQN